MPPPYNAQQRAAIQQFISFTQQRESAAAKVLKQNGWNVEQAVDAHFRGSNQPPAPPSRVLQNLQLLFNKYRDDPVNNPDKIGVEGAMRYLADVKVNLEEAAMLSIFELVNSPAQGEITRLGFCDGWQTLSCDTIDKQASYIKNTIRKGLPTNPDLFRRTYRYTFILARASDAQKSIPLDVATEFWRLLFSPKHGGYSWSAPNSPWFDWWLEFLELKWKRGVNRDMWDQLGVFMMKSVGDEELSFWSEDGAWPGAIDEFVMFVREKRKVDEGEEDDAMEE